MSERTIVAVTSSTKPYLYDLPHLLSLPDGFESRFRYFVDWVASDVADVVDRDESFAGSELVLVYHSLETSRLLPVRRAEVIQLVRRGPMYHLRFRVRDFPPLGPDLVVGPDRDAARQREGERLTAKGREWVDVGEHDLATPLPKSAFLRQTNITWTAAFGGNDPETPAQGPDRQWASLAALVMQEPNLADVSLFYLQGIVDRKGNPAPAKRMENGFAKGGLSGYGYQLVSGRRYRLQVLEWRGKDSPPSAQRLVCETDRSLLTLEGKSDWVLGKYDVLEYAIRTGSPGYSELTLTVEHSEVLPEAETVSWPPIYSNRVPVQVRRNRLKVAGVLGLALLGLAIYVLPTTPLAPAWVSKGIAGLAQLFGLALLFAAYGGFLSGYVSFASQAGGLVRPPGAGKTG